MPRTMASRSSGFICCGRRDIVGARTAVATATRRRPAPAPRAPCRSRRIRRRVREHRAPDRGGLRRSAPSCCAATPRKKRALGSLGIAASSARSNAAFASAVTTPFAAAISASPRSASRSAVCAVERSACAAPSRHRRSGRAACRPAPTHLPAAAVLGILLKMRLDLRDEPDRACGPAAASRRGSRAAGPAIAASRA